MTINRIFDWVKRSVTSAPKYPEFLDEWDDLLREQMKHWCQLTEDEQDRLEELTLYYMNKWHWEAQQGFALTDEMIVLIAASASVLVLDLDFDAYQSMTSVVVSETTIILDQDRAGPGGLVTTGPVAVLGHTSARGPVFLAWDSVKSGAGVSNDGFNVTYHEFAHRLDLLDGMVDGSPLRATDERYGEWIAVCTRLYEEVRNGHGPKLLRDYAGVNPAEFFAVVTEVFFDKGAKMESELPDLYASLKAFYRQDSAERDRRVRREHRRIRVSKKSKRRAAPVRGASGNRNKS